MTELEHHSDCDSTCGDEEITVLSELGEMEIINAFEAYVKHGSYPPPNIENEEELRVLCSLVCVATGVGEEVTEFRKKANFTKFETGEMLLMIAALALAFRLRDMALITRITEQLDKSGIADRLDKFINMSDDDLQNAQDTIRRVMEDITPEGLLELPSIADEEDKS